MKLERVERLNLGLSAGAVVASYALSTPHFATSVALGACLEAMNFGALMRGARHFFAGEIQGAGPWVGAFSLRFLLLGTGIFVFLQLGAHPAALLIGLSIAMPAVLIDAWIHRPDVVDPSQLPALDPDDESWDRWSVWRVAEVAPKEDPDDASLLTPGEFPEQSIGAKSRMDVPSNELDQQSIGAKPRMNVPSDELDQQSIGAKPRMNVPSNELDQQSIGAKPRSTKDDR